MGDAPLNWIGYLQNKIALENVFGESAPVLDDLMLAHLSIGQCGDVRISLNLPVLPDAIPARWITKGYDRLQLRLAFDLPSSLSIRGSESEGNVRVSASFGPGKQFSLSSPHFNVELEYEHVKADLYPYDSSIFEEPRPWRHQ